MCEWVSNGEWFDVRLLCGGRSFNVHRAVLASVSSFLKKVLLSCPNETPVFILLPEFDLEAMPFVLSYIYKGEVIIPKQKLKIFFDTANAMEIFIDHQYLTQANCEQYRVALKSGDETCTNEKNNICCFGVVQQNNRCYINLKKDARTVCLARQVRNSVNSLYLQNTERTEENIAKLGKQTSASGYRQRESFRRNIFIETYTRESDVTRQTVGMQVILNQNISAPTPCVLGDANNGKYPSGTDTLSYTSAYITSKAIFNAFHQLQLGNRRSTNEVMRPYEVCNQFKTHNFNFETSEELTAYEAVLKRSDKAFGHGDNQSLMKELAGSHIDPRRTIAKATILNEVLQSPWHPQHPNSYKPFRRKDLKSIESEKNFDSKINSTNTTNNIALLCQTNKKDYVEFESLDHQEKKCPICFKIFKGMQDYELHVRLHSSGARYNCEECHKTFSQLRNFKYHMSVHRGTKEFATICSICGKHFNDRGYLSNHMKIHRNRKEYKCTSCPKSFNQRVAYNMHVRIHTGVKPHVCEVCGKAFSRKMLLKQHQRTHSGERPYACTYCDRRFADRSNMTLHLRLHTGVKPFSCTLCPKSFSKKHHLKSHLNFHTGVKPYSCPRCKLTFTQSSNMRTHLKKCDTVN